MHLCTCVSEEGGDGERTDSEEISLLSYTLRFGGGEGAGESGYTKTGASCLELVS